MKRRYIILLILLLIPFSVHAKKQKVDLVKCIDGDTITILINKEETKVRMLSIDTPEIDKNEKYANEAKEYTCDILKKAKKIYIEDDTKSDKYDKYDRLLAWVWADDILLQKELVKNGFAKVAYTYDEYKYTSELREFEKNAKDKKLNIWSDHKETKNEKKKSKTDIYLDRLNKHYQILAILIGMVLALLTYSKTKNNDKRKRR